MEEQQGSGMRHRCAECRDSAGVIKEQEGPRTEGPAQVEGHEGFHRRAQGRRGRGEPQRSQGQVPGGELGQGRF